MKFLVAVYSLNLVVEHSNPRPAISCPCPRAAVRCSYCLLYSPSAFSEPQFGAPYCVLILSRICSGVDMQLDLRFDEDRSGPVGRFE
jgi:hypothetical protein